MLDLSLTSENGEARSARRVRAVVPLRLETRALLSTTVAAHHLSAAASTLRGWAASGSGPMRAVRVGGRWCWRTDDVRRLVGMEEAGE